MSLIRRIGIPSLIILLMQLSMYPYVLYKFFGFPDERILCIAFFAIIAVYCMFLKHKGKGIPNDVIFIMILQSAGWLFYFLLFDDTSYFTRIFFILLTFLSLLMLKWKDAVFKYLGVYCKFLTIQGVLGIVAFILVFIGILQPFMSLASEGGLGAIRFYGITCSNEVLGNFMRVGGFFDEPGAFAFWGMFALLFNKLTDDNRRLEVILIISLFFTFSAAYFVLLPIYFACFYSTKIKSMILAFLIVVPFLFVTFRTLSSNSDFMYYTVERFSGDRIQSKRYDQSDNAEAIFRQSPVFGQGGRKFETMGGNTISDNPYEILAKDGVVGFVITYFPLLYIVIRYRKKKEVMFASGILFLDYMQRPFHINEMHYFMLYLFCLTVVLKYNKKISRLSHTESYDGGLEPILKLHN
ncbi:O-antigen ligase family protein [Xylanibacter brevis]|uniref:O-antigen ligase family protein n=1 Tax=Xylanibacter brevis TaxID=83231 RepID=UPI0012DCDC83|nr:O-antigen ligase family protein [Xylanibacter brevis]